MKWTTRSNVKVDRVACPWLIRRSLTHRLSFSSSLRTSLSKRLAERSDSVRRKPASQRYAESPGRTLYVRGHSRGLQTSRASAKDRNHF